MGSRRKFKPQFIAFSLFRLNKRPFGVESRLMVERNFSKFSLLLVGSFLNLAGLSAQDSLPSVMDLQRSYIEKNGGLSNIQALKSLVVFGKILDGSGDSLDFKLYRKRPNFYRMQLERPNVNIITAHDGKKTQRKIKSRVDGYQMVELSDVEKESIRQNSEFDGPFYQLRGRPEWLTLVGLTEVNEIPAYELEVSAEADSRYERIWLHAEHYQEIKLRKRPIDREETETGAPEEIFFSGFDQVDGVWLAKQIDQMKGENRLLTIKIDRVRANVGLFDTFFEKL